MKRRTCRLWPNTDEMHRSLPRPLVQFSLCTFFGQSLQHSTSAFPQIQPMQMIMRTTARGDVNPLLHLMKAPECCSTRRRMHAWPGNLQLHRTRPGRDDNAGTLAVRYLGLKTNMAVSRSTGYKLFHLCYILADLLQLRYRYGSVFCCTRGQRLAAMLYFGRTDSISRTRYQGTYGCFKAGYTCGVVVPS